MLKLEPIKKPAKELFYTVKEGEDRAVIAAKFEVLQDNIDILGNKNLTAGDKVVVDLRKYIYHIVMPGQTVNSISQLYGIDAQTIVANNDIKKIFVGQRLLISCK